MHLFLVFKNDNTQITFLYTDTLQNCKKYSIELIYLLPKTKPILLVITH